MKNAALFPEVTMLECLNYLHKYFPDNILVHKVLILFCSANQLLDITALAVLHYYVYCMLLFFDDSKFELVRRRKNEEEVKVFVGLKVG